MFRLTKSSLYGVLTLLGVAQLSWGSAQDPFAGTVPGTLGGIPVRVAPPLIGFCEDPDSDRICRPVARDMLPGVSTPVMPAVFGAEDFLSFIQNMQAMSMAPQDPPTPERIKSNARQFFNTAVTASGDFLSYLHSIACWEAVMGDDPTWTTQDDLDYARAAFNMANMLKGGVGTIGVPSLFGAGDQGQATYDRILGRSLGAARRHATKFLRAPKPPLHYANRHHCAQILSSTHTIEADEGSAARLGACMDLLAPVFEGETIMLASPLVMSQLHLQRFLSMPQESDVDQALHYLEHFLKFDTRFAPFQDMFAEYTLYLNMVMRRNHTYKQRFAAAASELYYGAFANNATVRVQDLSDASQYYAYWVKPYRDHFIPDVYGKHLEQVALAHDRLVSQLDASQDEASFHQTLSRALEIFEEAAGHRSLAGFRSFYLQRAANIHASRLEALGDFKGEYAMAHLPRTAQVSFLKESAKAHHKAAECADGSLAAGLAAHRASQDLSKALRLGLVEENQEEGVLFANILSTPLLLQAKEIASEPNWIKKRALARQGRAHLERYEDFVSDVTRRSTPVESVEAVYAKFLTRALMGVSDGSITMQHFDASAEASRLWGLIENKRRPSQDDVVLLANSYNVQGRWVQAGKGVRDKLMAAELVYGAHENGDVTDLKAKTLFRIYADASEVARDHSDAVRYLRMALPHLATALSQGGVRIFTRELLPIPGYLAKVWPKLIKEDQGRRHDFDGKRAQLKFAHKCMPLVESVKTHVTFAEGNTDKHVIDEIFSLKEEAAAYRAHGGGPFGSYPSTHAPTYTPHTSVSSMGQSSGVVGLSQADLQARRQQLRELMLRGSSSSHCPPPSSGGSQN